MSEAYATHCYVCCNIILFDSSERYFGPSFGSDLYIHFHREREQSERQKSRAKGPNEKSLGEKRAKQKYLTNECHVQITENYYLGESLIIIMK